MRKAKMITIKLAAPMPEKDAVVVSLRNSETLDLHAIWSTLLDEADALTDELVRNFLFERKRAE